MADQPSIRLNKVLRELNISLDRAVEFLNQKGVDIDARPTTKIDTKVYNTLLDEFETDKSKKVASHEVGEEKRKEKESLRIIQEKKEQERLDQIAKREELKTNRVAIERPKSLGKIDLNNLNKTELKEGNDSVKIKNEKKHESGPDKNTVHNQENEILIQEEKDHTESPTDENLDTLKTQYKKLSGPIKTGQTINLDEVNEKEKTVEDARKRKRKRISKDVKPSVQKTNIKKRIKTPILPKKRGAI